MFDFKGSRLFIRAIDSRSRAYVEDKLREVREANPTVVSMMHGKCKLEGFELTQVDYMRVLIMAHREHLNIELYTIFRQPGIHAVLEIGQVSRVERLHIPDALLQKEEHVPRIKYSGNVIAFPSRH